MEQFVGRSDVISRLIATLFLRGTNMEQFASRSDVIPRLIATLFLPRLIATLFLRGTNMEQFASRSEVIKFPANLQNQTKITFILGVVPMVF